MLSEMNVPQVRKPGRPPVPPGWLLAGSDPSDYEVGADVTVVHSGSRSGFIQAQPNPRGFGTLMQQFKAESFRGMRLMLSAYVRTVDVDSWSGLWMRVDGPNDEAMSFDNMGDRPITGSTEWSLYKVVLDVPEVAEVIALGVLLQGSGKVWIDDVQLEPVSADVPTTGRDYMEALPATPTNLDFEHIESQ